MIALARPYTPADDPQTTRDLLAALPKINGPNLVDEAFRAICSTAADWAATLDRTLPNPTPDQLVQLMMAAADDIQRDQPRPDPAEFVDDLITLAGTYAHFAAFATDSPVSHLFAHSRSRIHYITHFPLGLDTPNEPVATYVRRAAHCLDHAARLNQADVVPIVLACLTYTLAVIDRLFRRIAAHA